MPWIRNKAAARAARAEAGSRVDKSAPMQHEEGGTDGKAPSQGRTGQKSLQGGQRHGKDKQQLKEDNVGPSPEVSKVKVKYNQEPRP